MTTETIRLIDESLDPIKKGANPLLSMSKTDMENYISIRSKGIPGKRAFFNHIRNVATKEVMVTGLFLNFSQDLSDSKLNSILGNKNIERFFLYADTIIINRELKFPQTNVTIGCRQLIIEEKGQIITTPESNPQPYATGGTEGNSAAGADGHRGGNITLLCGSIENKRKSGPAFILDGGKAQDGQLGGYYTVKHNDEFPLSWSKIETEAMSNDEIKGGLANWDWPDFSGIDKTKIYFASIWSVNLGWLDTKKREKKVTVGDADLPNQDNGADAYASGDGGDGGDAGDLLMLDHIKSEKDVTSQQKGGEKGFSKKIESQPPAQKSTFYHIDLTIWHKDINYLWNKDRLKYEPKVSIAKKLPAEYGLSAKGNDGVNGKDGLQLGPSNSEQYWLRPVLLETMLGYAKTHFRDGDRNKAQWILDHYALAIDTIPLTLRDDMHLSSLIREVELYHRRLNQNLDFYGYPPGWIPRMSALSNLKILNSSRRDLAQLIYFANTLLKQDDENSLKAKNLEWAVNELREGMEAAQGNIVAAFEALPSIKQELFVVESKVAEQLAALRALKAKILLEIEEKERAQALFTGAFEIAAGICVMIPVGQPYVGAVGSVLSQIGKIDIDSENPLTEGLNFATGLTGELSTFVNDNKGKISKDANSGLTKEVTSGTKELNQFEGDIQAVKADRLAAEAAVVNKFSDQELAILHERVRVIDGLASNAQQDFSHTEDYVEILGNLDILQAEIDHSKDLREADKNRLSQRLKELNIEKKELAGRLKIQKEKRTKREKNVENAGKALKGLTTGLSGVSSGIQKMMVEFDPDSPEVKAKFEKIMASKYKQEFVKINEAIDAMNKLKLPLVDRLLWFEQRISQGVQRINNSLVQWSVLNDQRVEAEQHGLLPSSRSILQRIEEESWALLMQECYYLTKSYQYRFLRRIDPIQHGIKSFIEDVAQQSEGVNPGSMDVDAYNLLFEKVLRSQFHRLGVALLTDTQEGQGTIETPSMTVTIVENDKNSNGDFILQRFNETGRAQFRFDEIESGKKGTKNWKFYRIIGIEFLNIKLRESHASFDFGIRHSGESIVRDQKGTPYFFTSISSQNNLTGKDGGSSFNLQVQSWNGSYDASERENENGGVSTAPISSENDKILRAFLSDFDLVESFEQDKRPYRDYYPSAQSTLSLVNYDEAEDGQNPKNYGVEELKFKVIYEVLR
ncbi:hypothetical protein [Algoriphagus sp. Y33]|uniref:hypothetical protein n=1 Tax=Algoriphagus sp. Y33 TaxID=2772483 RepID=UPI0017814991|nr:hypothetical protein [Algoriphagus sp. Y33]